MPKFRVSPVLATLGGLQGRAVPGGRAVSRLPAPIQRRDQGGVPAERHPVGVGPIDDDVQSALIGARHAWYVRIPQEWLGDDVAFSPDRFTRYPEPGQLDEFRTAGQQAGAMASGCVVPKGVQGGAATIPPFAAAVARG